MSRSLHAILAGAFLLFLSTGAMAQTGALLLLRPVPEDTNFETINFAQVQAKSETDNNNADIQIGMYESIGRITEKPDRFLPRIGYNFLAMDVNSDDPAIPDHLYDMAIAGGFKLPDISDFTGGITVGVGYAGNNPFGDGNAWYAKATIVFGKKLSETEDLALLLDYDGNRTFAPELPIPGIIYRKRISDKLLAAVGFPVSSIEYTPTPDWKFELVYTAIDRFDIRANYQFIEHWSAYASYESRREAFHIEGLDAGNHDRLLYEQKRVEVGVRWDPTKAISATLGVGYAFAQEFNVGFDLARQR